MDNFETKYTKIGRNRSFGRISSYMSRDDQEKLDARLVPYAFECPAEGKIDLSSLFPKHTASTSSKLVVELGIGNGELLGIRARDNASDHFIGAEVYKNGLKTLVHFAEEHQLQNLKLFTLDGRDMLDALPDESVDQLVILYPDPWPKKRHNKRRIVNKDLLEIANRILKENGELFMATDIPDYACWMITETYTHGTFFPTAISPNEWGTAPTWWHSTKYERKAIKQGRKPFYLTFKKNVDKSNTKCAPEMKEAKSATESRLPLQEGNDGQ